MAESAHGAGKDPAAQKPPFSFPAFIITFILMFITWIILSGNFSGLIMGLAVFSSALVAYFFHDLLFPSLSRAHVRIFFKFLCYIPWLILEIIKANFHILFIVFHPRMNDLIDPRVVTFTTDLKSDLAITTLANSITLTPGTTTVTAVREGIFRVHAIDKSSADSLPGTMLEKTADIFGEYK